MITLRDYKPSDAAALQQLFYDTVHHINCRDYTPAQVAAWALGSIDSDIWQQRMDVLRPFVAVQDDRLVGYADLQDDGLIDHFFCHHLVQGLGVGQALVRR